jgi:hypothetical protein
MNDSANYRERTSNFCAKRLTPSGAGLLVLALLVSGCGKSERDVELQTHDKHVEECRVALAKNPLIPIIGGGRLDTKYFAFNVPTVRFEKGECGTDGFVSDFYWTGTKIVPADPKFTGLALTQVPKEWRLLRVGARLGNMSRSLACEAKFDPSHCPDPNDKAPGYPPAWAQELVVRPKRYPGLEIWIDPKPIPRGLQAIHFVLGDWRREDGRPRTVNCDIRREVASMTRADFEEIDFGTNSFPCQVEFSDFSFTGGAARVSTGTDALRDAVPALKALQAYLSQAVDRTTSK